MDIKEKISEMIEKLQADEGLLELFKSDPIKAVEKILGVDLPDDIVEKIIDGVKGKISLDKAKDLLGGLKNLF